MIRRCLGEKLRSDQPADDLDGLLLHELAVLHGPGFFRCDEQTLEHVGRFQHRFEDIGRDAHFPEIGIEFAHGVCRTITRSYTHFASPRALPGTRRARKSLPGVGALGRQIRPRSGAAAQSHHGSPGMRASFSACSFTVTPRPGTVGHLQHPVFDDQFFGYEILVHVPVAEVRLGHHEVPRRRGELGGHRVLQHRARRCAS